MLLSVDLGGAKSGYIVVDKEEVITCGLVITEKSQRKQKSKSIDDFDRAKLFSVAFETVIEEYDVKAVLIEIPGGTQSSRAAKMFGLSIGAMAALKVIYGFAIEFYLPGEVKKGFTGSRTASKEEIIRKVIKDLKLETKKSARKNSKTINIKLCDKWFSEAEFEHIADSFALYQTAKIEQSQLFTLYG